MSEMSTAERRRRDSSVALHEKFMRTFAQASSKIDFNWEIDGSPVIAIFLPNLNKKKGEDEAEAAPETVLQLMKRKSMEKAKLAAGAAAGTGRVDGPGSGRGHLCENGLAGGGEPARARLFL